MSRVYADPEDKVYTDQWNWMTGDPTFHFQVYKQGEPILNHHGVRTACGLYRDLLYYTETNPEHVPIHQQCHKNGCAQMFKRLNQ